jgi:nucleoside phosphorylase/tetratricopeptide (TPR) repeat protein
VYESGTFATEHLEWEVIVGQTGMGNGRASSATTIGINEFKPDVAIFVGVAGGIKDVSLGDVVASSKIYGYEIGKETNEFRPRPDVPGAAHRLIQRALQVARDNNWQKRTHSDIGTSTPRALVGAIASGEKVIGSSLSVNADLIRRHYSDSLALEMEGYGFLTATVPFRGTHAIVVRGISDLVDDKSKSDSEGWQPTAAMNAAAFVFEMLYNTNWPNASTPATDENSTFNPSQQPFPEESLQVPSRVPPGIGQLFGREPLMAQLHDLLAPHSNKHPQMVAIHGMSGVGKTQLAIEYVTRFRTEYSLVRWISGKTQKEVEASLVDLTEDLPIHLPSRSNPQDSIELLNSWLEGNPGWLLIFDDVSPDALSGLVPTSGEGSILATSLDPSWRAITNQIHEVTGLLPDDAIEFIQSRTGLANRAEIGAIAEELASLPLALEQAAAYLETTGLSLAEYGQLLRDFRPLLMAERSAVSPYPLSVYAAIGLNIEVASASSAVPVEVLSCITQFGSQPISRDLISRTYELLCKDQDSTFNTILFNDALRKLAKQSLVTVTPTNVSCHALVESYVIDNMTFEQSSSFRSVATRGLDSIFPNVVNDSKVWPIAEKYLPQLLHLVQEYPKDAIIDDQEELTSILLKAGVYLHTRGRNIDSVAILKDALEITTQLHGADSKEASAVLSNLVGPLSESRQVIEAIAAGEKALAILNNQDVLGEEGKITKGVMLCNLGRVYLYCLKDFATARQYMGQALQIHQSMSTPHLPAVAIDLNNLGASYREEGWANANRGNRRGATEQFRHAHHYFAQAVAIHRQTLDKHDYRLAVAIYNLGAVSLLLEDLAPAEALLREAVEINDVLGNGATGWDQFQAIRSLARTLRVQAKLPESLKQFDRAIELGIEIYGDGASAVSELREEVSEIRTLMGSRTLLVFSSDNPRNSVIPDRTTLTDSSQTGEH